MSDLRRLPDPRADELRRRYCQAFGAPDALPVAVERIAVDLLGLLIEEVDDLPVSGALIPNERVVLLNRAEPPLRRRFTLAHEIGHWVCQCDEGRGTAPAIMCRGADLDEDVARDREREANRFAATLLMPDTFVTPDLATSPVDALADRFGVSQVAMAWRLYNAGLVEDVPPRGAPEANHGSERQ